MVLRLPRRQRLRYLATLPLHVVLANAATLGDFDAQRCAACQGLQYCTALNGKLLFDPVVGYTRYVQYRPPQRTPCRPDSSLSPCESQRDEMLFVSCWYLSAGICCTGCLSIGRWAIARDATSQLAKQGVCEDLDAKTLALSRFGTEFQFKDSATCRTLVWNFHCLSWAAATFARVIDGTQVECATISATASASVGSPSTPLPPCRSLCVEVADKCVYSHLYRSYLENVCGNIACVSEEEEKSSANSSTPKTQAACVHGAWETSPNSTFSRCSIREYVPPKSAAVRLQATTLAMLLLVVATSIAVMLNN